MKLSVGRIVHVTEPTLHHCLAAIVTAVNEDQNYADSTIFTSHGPANDLGRRYQIPISESDKWHDPRECHND